MSDKQPPPTSRTYIHDRCEQPTIVAKESFAAVASPLSGVEQTYCNACKSMYAVDEYRWADTNEKLTDYYKRHGNGANALDRFIASRHSLIAALVVAIGLGIAMAVIANTIQGTDLLTSIFIGIGVCVLAVTAMATVIVSVLTPIVHRRVCNVSDPRHLI
ncbi:hypothetical protein LOC67_24290 [Stieleria sp. JC731]|uniref:hypothetical protein n=1 Tax=Pirellulaceae TaxID=2691357 RepID=UPI001E5AF695|nr:hypothetical protein [Stieleria sp. JC731]MCC9603681.1 hypothetical protein [Stieleria sp. JC731]